MERKEKMKVERRFVVYPILSGKIAEKGLVKDYIAQTLGITPRCLANKLNGKTGFTWSEVKMLHKELFPEVDIESLMTEAKEGWNKRDESELKPRGA